MQCGFLHIGAPTLILDIAGLRLITDPVFDPPGKHYGFGWGTGSNKMTAPAIPADAVGHLDAVLLSHDHHADNLDPAGRALLSRADRVITTVPGARRLGGSAVGLADWEQTHLSAPNGLDITITATPARHGPPGSRPLVGAVIGFMLEWQGQTHGALYISGDTVYFGGIQRVAERFKVGTAVLHLGRASFPITGPLRFTMHAADGVRAAQTLNPHTIIPVHYDGWSHFREPKANIGTAFSAAGLANRLTWLTPGHMQMIEV